MDKVDIIIGQCEDGEGFDNETKLESPTTLGLEMGHGLARQINGNIEKGNTAPGTKHIISFEEIV